VLFVGGEFLPVPDDARRLCFRAFSIRQADGITSPNLRFGSGWYPCESSGGRMFRWASNGASIEVHAPRRQPVLKADLEPGPGTRQRPFRIDLITGQGERIFTTAIRTREQIQVQLPLAADQFATFHIRGDETMIVSPPGDPRQLIFRAFEIAIG
jgi:hypothetical protein